ncbi:MAG: type II toxin-antitoxin system RelE/ParE family toxin [Planctomycetes bacterium]|nr:type II toxin-antitoxin system RelE/ParE family toxin [Planctomycetota bacterium]
MTYTIRFVPNIGRQLSRLDPSAVRKIKIAIDSLAHDPRPHGCIKMQGEPTYRIRVGNYRVVYEINDTSITVLVVKIGHRRDVYR